jgi:cytoskeletal protein CcmA (bactofilin family)
MFSEKIKTQNGMESLIGSTARIEGIIHFSGVLRVEGYVCGAVVALPGRPGTLIVSEPGHIDGEVRAPHVIVKGVVIGTIHAAEMLELQATSRLKGDVHYKNIDMRKGAVVEGHLVHEPASK